MTANAFRVAILVTVGALVVGGPVLGITSLAQAHNYLVSSTPASGSTITRLPDEFEITTNGPLLSLGGSTGGFALEVRDAEGTYYSDGCVTVTGASITEAAALGPAGTYTVLWQVVSTDGHTVSGEYDFTWAPDAGQKLNSGSTTPRTATVRQAGIPQPSPVAETPRGNADLGDVLWIGGAVGVVLIAGLVTFVILGRRNRA